MTETTFVLSHDKVANNPTVKQVFVKFTAEICRNCRNAHDFMYKKLAAER